MLSSAMVRLLDFVSHPPKVKQLSDGVCENSISSASNFLLGSFGVRLLKSGFSLELVVSSARSSSILRAMHILCCRNLASSLRAGAD